MKKLFGDNKSHYSQSRVILWLTLSFVILFGVACAPTTPKATPTPAFDPSITPSASPTASSTPTITPAPTSTPISGTIKISPSDGMAQVYIPGSTFTSMDGLKITLDSYWIDQTEITNAMFEKFVQATGYQTQNEILNEGSYFSNDEHGVRMVWESGVNWKHPRGSNSNLTGLENHPVVQVAWSDASAYCTWAGRHLPTDTEWELAARGNNDGRNYPWGSSFNCANGNFDDEIVIDPSVVAGGPNCDRFKRTSPVNQFPSDISPFGLLDMAGNVMEWVADYTGPRLRTTNPIGPSWSETKIIRGGSWKNGDGNTYIRGGNYPERSVDDLGFRCAYSLVPNIPNPITETQTEISGGTQEITTENLKKVNLLGSTKVIGPGAFSINGNIAWSPDNKLIAVTYYDWYSNVMPGTKTIHIWDTHNMEEVNQIGKHEYAIMDIDWSNDGNRLISPDKDTIRVWGMPDGKEIDNIKLLQDNSDAIYPLDISPDGKFIAFGTGRSEIGILNTEDHDIQLIRNPIAGPYGYPVSDIEWSPKGNFLASVYYEPDRNVDWNKNVLFTWDFENNSELFQSIMDFNGSLVSVSWSYDGKMVSASGNDGSVHVFDSTLEGEVWKGEGRMIARWSPKANILATVNGNKDVLFYDSQGNLLFTNADYRVQADVLDIAWSLDGTRLAIFGQDGVLRIYGIP